MIAAFSHPDARLRAVPDLSRDKAFDRQSDRLQLLNFSQPDFGGGGCDAKRGLRPIGSRLRLEAGAECFNPVLPASLPPLLSLNVDR